MQCQQETLVIRDHDMSRSVQSQHISNSNEGKLKASYCLYLGGIIKICTYCMYICYKQINKNK